jgi:TPR repeat protein
MATFLIGHTAMAARVRRVVLGMLAVAAFSGAGSGFAEPKQDTDAAERAYARDDVVTAMALFRRAADAGYAPAQARLGDIFDAAEEDVLAVEYYRKAASQNLAAGEYGLGRMYDKGEGVAKDPAEALKWYLRAAEKDYLPAVQIIAQAYRDGALGLRASREDAEAWGKRVVRLGGSMPGLPRQAEKGEKK